MNTNRFIKNLKKATARLIPSYFALVMATGIIALAADSFQMHITAWVLFYLSTAAYIVLWFFFICRSVLYFRHLMRDFYRDTRSPGFLTIVAGTAILGKAFIHFENNYSVATFLYGVSLFFWCFLIYTLMTIMITKRRKPTLGQGMNGIWLLLVVSTESISILGTALAGHFTQNSKTLLFVSLFLFVLGSLLYIIIITLIFYRLTFFKLHPKEFLPAYWINMGAVAILTLAGTELLQHGEIWAILQETAPFIKAFSFLFWTTGSWWIPLIIILEIWRYAYKRTPIRYKPQQWGMVFPLGMFSVCTYHLEQEISMGFLHTTALVFLYIALLTWALTGVGLLGKIKTEIFKP